MKILYTIALISILAFVSCKKYDDHAKNSLVNLIPEPKGENCNDGGFKILTGIDMNENEILDIGEVQNEEFLCNGNNGLNSLIDLIPEPSGENCINGGYKIITGLDLNGNKIIDIGEVQKEEFLCNGESGNDGHNSLVQVIPEEGNENCPNGGYIINSGIDLNSDNILNENEIQSAVYICNGINTESDIQIRLSLLTIIGTNTYGNGGALNGYFIGNLEKFNKNYWPGVDSIVFVTNLQSANNISEASAELFDLSNNSIIANSTVSTNNTFATQLVSGNIINYLPNEEIDLTIQLRCENSLHQAMLTGKSYLLLYRKK